MTLVKTTIYLFIFSTFFLSLVLADPVSRTGKTRRLNIPWLGIGTSCNGCPPHYCDDDPAVIHGYCCGCARFYDVGIPVECGPRVDCPLNTYDLCQDYEYMMHCCC